VVDGEPVTLDILDTGGDEEFRHMLPQYARDYESFVLVYAINDHPSFEALEREFLTPIRDARPDQSRPPAVIVANKSDLGGSSYDGEQLAVRQGGLPFMRASARADLGIVEIFEHACREALKQRPVRQGYLLKQPGNWDPAKKGKEPQLQRRFVILTWDTLTYFEDEDAARGQPEPKGTIPVANIERAEPEPDVAGVGSGYAFVVACKEFAKRDKRKKKDSIKSQRSFLFCADQGGRREQEAWVAAIKKTVEPAPEGQPVQPADASGAGLGAPPPDPAAPQPLSEQPQHEQPPPPSAAPQAAATVPAPMPAAPEPTQQKGAAYAGPGADGADSDAFGSGSESGPEQGAAQLVGASSELHVDLEAKFASGTQSSRAAARASTTNDVMQRAQEGYAQERAEGAQQARQLSALAPPTHLAGGAAAGGSTSIPRGGASGRARSARSNRAASASSAPSTETAADQADDALARAEEAKELAEEMAEADALEDAEAFDAGLAAFGAGRFADAAELFTSAVGDEEI